MWHSVVNLTFIQSYQFVVFVIDQSQLLVEHSIRVLDYTPEAVERRLKYVAVLPVRLPLLHLIRLLLFVADLLHHLHVLQIYASVYDYVVVTEYMIVEIFIELYSYQFVVATCLRGHFQVSEDVYEDVVEAKNLVLEYIRIIHVPTVTQTIMIGL